MPKRIANKKGYPEVAFDWESELPAGLRLDPAAFFSSDLGRLDSYLDLCFLSELGLLGQFISHRIACVTVGDTNALEMLESFELGHRAGQLNEIDVGATCLGQDLDAGHHVVGETCLGNAVLCRGASYCEEFVCLCHVVLPF